MSTGERAPFRVLWEWAVCAGLAALFAVLVSWDGRGAGNRLLLMYLASGATIALGLLSERRLGTGRGYGETVLAAGLAGIYFTTYAAHAVPALAVIRHAGIAGALLLTCAVVMGWFAERRRAERIVPAAIVLAWLACTTQAFALFTHFSNLLLAALAVWFVLRGHRGTAAWVSLFAVYLGFLIWWPYSDGSIDPDRYLQFREFRTALTFFAGYWVLFTVCAARASEQAFATSRRVVFATLNNVLFFAWGVLVLPPRYPDWFWKFTLAFGAALLVTAFLCHAHRRLRRAFLFDGALVVALSFFSVVTGRAPGPMLALGSLFLVLLVEEAGQPLRGFSAFVVAILAVAFAWQPAIQNVDTGIAIGVLTGVPLVFAAWWISRSREFWGRWAVEVFAALGLGVWLLTTLGHAPAPHQPPLLALEAVLLTASFALLAVREFPYLAKGFLLAGQVLWFIQIESFVRPWWNPLAVVVATLAISLWWQRRGRSLMPAWELAWVQALAGAVVVGVLLLWLEGMLAMTSTALVLMSALALATTLYALRLRDWFLAAFAQLFAATAIGEFIGQLSHPPLPHAAAAFTPIPVLIVLAAIVRAAFAETEWSRTARIVAIGYRAAAAVMFVIWTVHFIAEPNRFLALAATGVALLLVCVRSRARAPLLESLILGTGALIVFWATDVGRHGFLLRDLLAFVLMLGFGVIGRREKLLPPIVQEAGEIIGLVSVWRWVTLWAAHHFQAMPESAIWSVVAVVILCFGWWLREPLYRAVSWAILMAAAVWLFACEMSPPPTFRLGLLALGVAFLAFAFSYARREIPAASAT